jgi:hypothetical protein
MYAKFENDKLLEHATVINNTPQKKDNPKPIELAKIRQVNYYAKYKKDSKDKYTKDKNIINFFKRKKSYGFFEEKRKTSRRLDVQFKKIKDDSEQYKFQHEGNRTLLIVIVLDQIIEGCKISITNKESEDKDRKDINRIDKKAMTKLDCKKIFTDKDWKGWKGLFYKDLHRVNYDNESYKELDWKDVYAKKKATSTTSTTGHKTGEVFYYEYDIKELKDPKLVNMKIEIYQNNKDKKDRQITDFYTPMCRDIVKNTWNKCKEDYVKELNEYNVLEFDIIKMSTLAVCGTVWLTILVLIIFSKLKSIR